MTNKFPHAFSMIKYVCPDCGLVQQIYNSRDGDIPKHVVCSCSKNKKRVLATYNRHECIYEPNHKYKRGERIFIDYPKSIAIIYSQMKVEATWQYLQNSFKTKDEAIEKLLHAEWKEGNPFIITL